MGFETALTGLNAASSDLNVISNNIANASTTGFKASRAEFADIFASTSSTAIGNGVRLASVAQQFSQGSVTITQNNLDLAINGQGFFRLNDNGNIVYSRAGQFQVDNNGYMVNSNGQRLTAYTADAAGNISGATGSVQLSSADIPPTATTTVTLGLNVDASQNVPTTSFNITDPTSFNHSTSTSVYDSFGSSHLMSTYYVKTGASAWDAYTYIDGSNISNGPVAGVPTAGKPDKLVFGSDGKLSTINATAVPPYTLTTGAFTPPNGSAPLTLAMNYGGLTQFGSGFSVNSLTQDGFTTGRVSGVDIGNTGVIFARYTNGQSKALGQVVLSNFANPQGLRQLGNTTWAETFNSGAALTGAPGSSSLGSLQSGALEQSNVDISQALVSMITAQRNYQANAQVISTANQITQTLINKIG